VKPVVNIAVAGLRRFFLAEYDMSFQSVQKIIIDNVKQFDCHIFKDFCHHMGVEAVFASVYHPQSNGAVEKANTLKFTAIKRY
jgi:transposase